MAVDTFHQDYTANREKWKRVRDVLAGNDAVKIAGQAYLPKPGGHSDTDYLDYIMRAEFYPASQRTVDGLVGAVFRKNPMIDIPTGVENIVDQATLKGTDYVTFSQKVVREVVEIGRYGVLVDVMDGDQRPFVAGYTAENIINWRFVFINRKPVLTLVVLREWQNRASAENAFDTERVERYRVLQLGMIDGETEGPPVYAQSVFERMKDKGGKEQFSLISTTVPLRRGERLTEIPFHFFGPMDHSPDIAKSPILDLVDTNLSHYRTSAELEEGAYLTGLPMYVVVGRMTGGDEAAEFTVGSRNALRLDEGGSASVLTVSGDGMGLLKGLMESKEKRMAVLGARILEDQKSGVEAAASIEMRHRGESSVLASISGTVSRGLTTILNQMLWWNGMDNPGASITLNTDFVSAPMTPSEMVQLTSALMQGGIGPEVFFKALQDGERVPNDWQMKDWVADVENGVSLFERGMTNEPNNFDPGV